MSQESNAAAGGGIGVGQVIALYISGFVVKNTLGWIIIHTFFGWFYVIYYAAPRVP